MTRHTYVHGYQNQEHTRLCDQAQTLAGLLHADTVYPNGSRVLEAGCGVGAQTTILTRNNPQTDFVSIDISHASLAQAQQAEPLRGCANVSFAVSDLFRLPFAAPCFDHVFVCFVLEHLKDPLQALKRLRAVLKPGGTLTVIEGDHRSALFYPDSPAAWKTIECLIEIQRRLGGDALIGRRLYPLLDSAGLRDVSVSPRTVYADASKPERVEGLTRNTFIAMIQGVREQALACGLIDPIAWKRGIEDLHRTTASDGMFSYTFFKAVGVK